MTRRRASASAAACVIACTVACALPAAAFAQARAQGTPSVVQDPHHGDTLFHFFQSKYFSSITALMVSQHFERLPHHADDAEVLRGGMLLAYGMHREAEAIFTRLADTALAPAVRDRAWFFLAKIRHQRGLVGEARSALARIGDALPAGLSEDRALLEAQVLMAKGEDAAAARSLRELASREGSSAYLRFNLGVALVRAGDGAAGRALLEAIGTSSAADEEARTLRDKANVALGFAALKDTRHADARAALERVRLAGTQSNKALLGFGWAAAAAKDHEKALVPWQELTTRDGSEAAVLEARIAVPYALAELGASAQALRGYEDALEIYQREHTALEASIGLVRGEGFVDALARNEEASADADREMGWMWSMTSLPELPHPGHLAAVLAEHEFQESFKTWRDLVFLQRNLDAWSAKLASYGDMLALRRKAFADKLPDVRAKAQSIDLDAAAPRRAALAAEIERITSATDVAALADADDRALLERIDRARRTLDAAGLSTEEAGAARERLRLADGALTWRMTRAWPERLWALRKAMATIDRETAQARERGAGLARAQRDEPARLDTLARRLAALDTQLKALVPRVAALRVEQQRDVQAVAARALHGQQERLATYVRQARFAIAQLVDRAAVAALPPERSQGRPAPSGGGERGGEGRTSDDAAAR
jgi:hypothetical protein